MTAERIQVGINGLDEMLGGGFIPGTINGIIGSYGTGKTTFILNYIYTGLKNGENVIFISLEEREDRILQYMAQKGWDVSPYLNKSLNIIKMDPIDFNLAINNVKNELPELVKKLNVRRIAIDPISLFEDLFDSTASRRKEMFRFVENLKDLDCTLLMTSETSSEVLYSSRYNLIEYLCDTVILLRYVRPSELSTTQLAIEVVKMRLSPHSREIKPFEIMEDQILVYTEANVF